jgi:aldehyde dehydrogenase (NAD+)
MNPTDHHGLQHRIDRVFAAQQARALVLRRSTAAERIERLRLLLAAVERHIPAMRAAGAADFCRPEAEVDLTEVLPVVSEIRHTIRHLRRWMRPKRIRPTLALFGTSARILYEPRGVCLIVVPWNYPFNVAFGPLVSAIAAGNTAIIKPSEQAPAMSTLIREIVEETFDESEVAVFEGAADVATALQALPFDHVFFTGSPAVGKLVMAAAARHLSSITLELGGKSPTIVDPSANPRTAARNIMWGTFTNGGQTCIAPDYLLVQETVYDRFLAESVRWIESTYGSTPEVQRQSPDYCRIVNRRHYDRIIALLDDALARGARIVYGGQHSPDDRFISPTLLADVPLDSQIMREEVFGPVVPVLSYRRLDDAIAIVNARPKPLALYLYSTDRKNIARVLAETSAGDTVINHNLLHYLHLNLPFGGVNNSGIGKSHGFYGFEAFSHQRSVLRERFSVVHWLYPPYTAGVRKLIELTRRWAT